MPKDIKGINKSKGGRPIKGAKYNVKIGAEFKSSQAQLSREEQEMVLECVVVTSERQRVCLALRWLSEADLIKAEADAAAAAQAKTLDVAAAAAAVEVLRPRATPASQSRTCIYTYI